MDMDTFHERLFSMGFDLPQKIAADLNIAVQSGKMEITRFVSLLDTTVFKNNVLEDRMGKLGAMQGVFKRVIDAFLRQGYAVVQNLVMAFRRMDSDGDGCLSFQEFFEGRVLAKPTPSLLSVIRLVDVTVCSIHLLSMYLYIQFMYLSTYLPIYPPIYL